MGMFYVRAADPRAKGKKKKRRVPEWKKVRGGARRSISKLLDIYHARYIRSQYDACVTCGQPRREKFTCSHIFPRYHPATRWDSHPGGNCVVQCWHCNQKHEEDPTILYAWYTQTYGEEALHALRLRANIGSKPGIFDQEDMLRRFGYTKISPDHRVHTPPGWGEEGK